MPLVVLPKKLCDQDELRGKYYMKSRLGSLQNDWDKELLDKIDFRVESVPKKNLNVTDVEELAKVFSSINFS